MSTLSKQEIAELKSAYLVHEAEQAENPEQKNVDEIEASETLESLLAEYKDVAPLSRYNDILAALKKCNTDEQKKKLLKDELKAWGAYAERNTELYDEEGNLIADAKETPKATAKHEQSVLIARIQTDAARYGYSQNDIDGMIKVATRRFQNEIAAKGA